MAVNISRNLGFAKAIFGEILEKNSMELLFLELGHSLESCRRVLDRVKNQNLHACGGDGE